MKRRLIALMMALPVLLCLVCSVSAEERIYVTDDAGLLTGSERSMLEEMAAFVYDTYSIDAAILTVDSLGGKSAQSYADDYYDQNGYAEDGLLLLLAMEEREWYISTSGSAIYAFTDYGLMRLEETIVPQLSEGNYYGAFYLYLDCVPDYLDAYLAGTPIDGEADNYGSVYHDEVVHYTQEKSVGDILLTSVIIGLAVAAVSILVMRYSMNTKRQQHSAGDYLKKGSFHLHTHRDIYLYSNVSKVRRQQNTSRSGGSSVHRSSSGRSHGGRGGRF